MTYKEACIAIVKPRYGLQSIYEDKPRETKARLKEENEYYKSVIDRIISIAWEAINTEGGDVSIQ